MELAGFLLLARDLSAHSCPPLPHEESRPHSGSQPRALCPLSSITWVVHQQPWPCFLLAYEFPEDWTPSSSTFYLYARVLGDN